MFYARRHLQRAGSDHTHCFVRGGEKAVAFLQCVTVCYCVSVFLCVTVIQCVSLLLCVTVCYCVLLCYCVTVCVTVHSQLSIVGSLTSRHQG